VTNVEAPARQLSREVDGRPVAPVRVVHLGVGNFFRAHQAWYTEHADDADRWGIAAFTGHSRRTADELSAQDGLYTLLVRHESESVPEVVASLSAVHVGADLATLRGHLASPDVAVVTLTVTEAGYCRNESGGLDLGSEAVQADVAALRDGSAESLDTVPGRLVAGLAARRDAGAGGLAVVSCDNVPHNGAMARRVVTELAQQVDPSLAAWIESDVSFVTTMVDRITPRATEEDAADARALTGVDDPALVITEPFTEWVLAGDFPAGRPAWETAGARFVDDVRPFETRKLWLLNGAHSIMAYAGSIVGHETVADAIMDPEVFGWVEDWWDCAARYLTLPEEEVAAYRQALFDRFANPNIRHRLAQIAADGSQKVPIRALPVLRAAREEGALPSGATRFVAAWIAHLRGHGAPVQDVEAATLTALAQGPVREGAAAVLEWLGLDDLEVSALVEAQVADLESRSARR
jgi:fructuronate reductase